MRFLSPPLVSRLRLIALVAVLLAAVACLLTRFDLFRASAQIFPPTSFRNFESPQTHPLAMTTDGARLLAVNSPAGTLSVFQVTGAGLAPLGEIPVGLEPVSVAVRAGGREAWVTNWLSDSVSIVDLATGNVTRTIDVGDEPTDVVFAGSTREMAFVCVSGRNQVKVYDPSNPTAAPQTIDIFGKQPRALARNATGSEVYVSVFESGNRTTIVPEPSVTFGGGLPPPNPALAPGLPAPPPTALIVKHNGAAWLDEIGRSWNFAVPYTLADIDLVVINAAGNTATASAQLRGVATHVGNAAFNPVNNQLIVANLESDNLTRFEPNLSGRFQSSRVSFVNLVAGGAPTLASVSDLNPHVDFTNPAGNDTERTQSLALPTDITRASDGTIYVAALSSARVGVLAPTGVLQSRISVGQGPTGLALDEARSRLYVLNRFDQTVSVVDTNSKTQTAVFSVGFNPEPTQLRAGRRFLYDAGLSSHGTVSCASCHLSGHRDGLAWDLGNPQGQIDTVQGFNFHPMKGPMTTQSLRGIVGTEPLHWRGDRTNLSQFNPAFESLLGGRQLTAEEMAAFDTFVRTLAYPPNPDQPLNRTLTPQASAGRNAFFNVRLDGNLLTCNQCHTVNNPGGTGTNGAIIPGQLLQEPQPFKVPQLRGLNQKTGLTRTPGEKITGYGFIHDGSFDTLDNFLRAAVFTFPAGQAGNQMRSDIEQFLLTLDTGVAPAVGLQVTSNAENKTASDVTARINLLIQQSAAGNCELIVRGLYGGAQRSFLHVNGLFQPDSGSEARLTLQQLLDAVGTGSELTFTGVPLGRGRQMALDRDGDGVLNDDAPRSSVQITGRVVDAAGNGVAGVTVNLSGAQSAVVQTDAAGRFTFGLVSTTGTHVVTPAAGGFTFSPASRTIVNPAWNQTTYFLAPATTANPVDAAQFFVTQHYNDFFGREPDAPGLAFWSGQITECGADIGCTEVRRINVSAAFYLSIEFQQTGFLVHRLTEASFDRSPRYGDFFPDTQRLGRGVIVNQGNWQQLLDANRAAFIDGWVQRTEFKSNFDALGNQQYVDTLVARAGIPEGQIDKATLVSGLNSNTETRASVLLKVAENPTFIEQEKSRAFVLMQYLGYLRRDADSEGFGFWLGKLNQFGGDYIAAEMVKAFIISGEYRGRFRQ